MFRLSDFYPYLKMTPRFINKHFHASIDVLKKIIPVKCGRTHNFLFKIDEIMKNGNLSQKLWCDNAYVYSQDIINGIFPLLSQYDYRDMYHDIIACAYTPEYALLADWKTMMKDKFLIKVDRAMMSVSLEGREPMLDHRIAEYVAQLPWDYKYKNGEKKRILKDIVYDYLPKELMDKPKRGFSPPLNKWMREDLHDYVWTHINATNVIGIEYQKDKLYKIVNRFMTGDNSLSYEIWVLVQLIAWYQHYLKNA